MCILCVRQCQYEGLDYLIMTADSSQQVQYLPIQICFSFANVNVNYTYHI